VEAIEQGWPIKSWRADLSRRLDVASTEFLYSDGRLCLRWRSYTALRLVDQLEALVKRYPILCRSKTALAETTGRVGPCSAKRLEQPRAAGGPYDLFVT